jgi:hypothetical protein
MNEHPLHRECTEIGLVDRRTGALLAVRSQEPKAHDPFLVMLREISCQMSIARR